MQLIQAKNAPTGRGHCPLAPSVPGHETLHSKEAYVPYAIVNQSCQSMARSADFQVPAHWTGISLHLPPDPPLTRPADACTWHYTSVALWFCRRPWANGRSGVPTWQGSQRLPVFGNCACTKTGRARVPLQGRVSATSKADLAPSICRNELARVCCRPRHPMSVHLVLCFVYRGWSMIDAKWLQDGTKSKLPYLASWAASISNRICVHLLASYILYVIVISHASIYMAKLQYIY